jgi:uncharacterized cupin superfamily protein
VTLVHWDDVEGARRAKGPMDATWQRLGDAAGGHGVGVNRIRVAPGKLPTPPHSHAASEEIYYVLGGSGLLWQDEAVCEVRAGDTIVEVADHFEHTFKAGDDGLDLLAFGTRHPVEYGWLPRSRATRFGFVWVEGRFDDPWDVEAGVGELELAAPGDRPENVTRFDELPLDEDGDKVLATTSEKSGLNWVHRASGMRGAVPHTHSAEHEAFVVLEGSGTLELWDRDGSVETHDVRPGHVVARPAASRVSHSIKAGPDGIAYLAYGTREPNDICWYPRSNKVYFRGIGLMGRIERLDYWDGESLQD